MARRATRASSAQGLLHAAFCNTPPESVAVPLPGESVGEEV